MEYLGLHERREKQNKASNYIIIGITSLVLVGAISYNLLCNHPKTSSEESEPTKLEKIVYKLVKN